MPIRPLIASLIVAALLAAGASLILARQDASLADFVALLQLRSGSMMCVFVAWASAAAGVVALLTAFAAFLELDDYDGIRARGFPKGAPLLFLILALALFWMALSCLKGAAAPPPAPAAVETPAATEALEAGAPAAAPEPAVEPVAAGPEPALQPPVVATETALVWDYQYPLVRGEEYVYSPSMSQALASTFPRNDPRGDVRAMLCGKAWVAFAGAASEEGPRDRNERRARRRAELAAGAASDWLDAQDDCRRPAVLAFTLGQHAATTVPLADAGQSTGYQRQLIVVSRDRLAGEETSAPAAARELKAYLADEDSLAAMLGGRRYRSPPEILSAPGDGY